MDLSNVSILNLMPPNLAADKNIQMMAEAFDEALREIIKKIPNVAIIPNLVLDKIVNETLIDLLAWQFHVDFYDPELPIDIKRKLVLKSLDWHSRKGTPSVVEEIVSTVFSDAELEEWYEYGGLPYRFRITTEEPLPNQQAINELIRAVRTVKNTRSYLDTIIAIRRGIASAYCGIVPAVDGEFHLLAEENEPHGYAAVLPAVYGKMDVPASENDAVEYAAVVPALKFRVDVLSAEGDL